jgi:DNA-binding IclR family transcriptional regulator
MSTERNLSSKTGDPATLKKDAAAVGYKAPAVQKAFRLLDAVARSGEGMGISEISEELGFSKGTTHGLIQALLEVGALEQSPFRKKVFLGASLVELSKKAMNYNGVAADAQPILDALGKEINEAVFLGVLNQTKATIIALSRNNWPLGISSSPGATIPLMAGAVGKAFLASLKNREALNLIRLNGLEAFTPNSILDEKTYLKALDWVRRNGYALDDEEYLVGIKAVAVNVGNRRGLPLLVWVVALAATMSAERISAIVRETMAAAGQLRKLLENRPHEDTEE